MLVNKDYACERCNNNCWDYCLHEKEDYDKVAFFDECDKFNCSKCENDRFFKGETDELCEECLNEY